MGILSGLRVLELSAFVAVPLAGATLAAMGADVIRIDPVGGGIDGARLPRFRGRSLYWAGLNQGKRSVTLDVRSRAGGDALGRLLRRGGADGGIVITNLPARGALSYERLREVRPDLIMVALRGNPDGSTAVDYTVNARLGFPEVTGPAGWRGPVNHALPAWDAQAGYLVAMGVLAAERHRRLTGEGQMVSLSLLDVGLSLTARLGALAEAELVAEPRGRFGNFVYGTFGVDLPTGDGRRVMVVALTPGQWIRLLRTTGLGEEMGRLGERLGLDLMLEDARWAARREIEALLSRWTERRDLDQIARAFEESGVLWAPFQSFKELLSDPLAAPGRSVLARVRDGDIGEYSLPRSPLQFGAFEPAPPAPPPSLGQDTDAVLRHLAGMDDRELTEMRAAGLAGEPQPGVGMGGAGR